MAQKTRREFLTSLFPKPDQPSESPKFIENPKPVKTPSQPKIEKPSKKMSRRGFLKRLSASTSYMMLGKIPFLNKLPNLTNQENTQENRTWTTEDILKNPIRFLSEMTDTISNDITGEASSIEQKFLDNFSPSFSSQPEIARHNLDVLGNAFMNLGYGERISSFISSAENINVLSNFSALSDWWASFKGIYSFTRDDVSGAGETMLDRSTNKLLSIVEWCEPLLESNDYDVQKKAYMEKGAIEIKESDLDEIVAQIWEALISGPLANINEDLARTEAGYKIFKKLIELIKKHFPLALYKLKYLDFTNRAGGRAYFNSKLDGAFLGNLFFEAMDLVERKDGDYSSNIGYLIREFLVVLLHELAHPFDPNQNPTENFTATHPEDMFSYHEEYLKMYEAFFEKFDREDFGPSGVEEFFLDPGAPKDFGTDEIISQNQLDWFNWEMNEMINVCIYLESYVGNEEKLPNKTNMNWFFDGGNNPNFRNWDAIFDEQKADFGYHGYEFAAHQETSQPIFEGVTTKISNFNQITVEHLTELKSLTNELFNSPQERIDLEGNRYLLKSNFFRSILHIKSMYLLAFSKFFADVEKSNLIDQNYPLFFRQKSIRDIIKDHLMHCLVGPVHEYLPYPGVEMNLATWGETNMIRAIEQAKDIRNRLEEKDLISWNPEVTETIEDLYLRAKNVRDKRARLWMADLVDENFNIKESYSEFERAFLEKMGLNVNDLNLGRG